MFQYFLLFLSYCGITLIIPWFQDVKITLYYYDSVMNTSHNVSRKFQQILHNEMSKQNIKLCSKKR